MKNISFKLYREYGALNSLPVFDAVETGLKYLGYRIDPINGDIPVIWSVLWAGRMQKNQYVYHTARSQKKPVLIIEVGNLQRNKTWRISLNNVNGHGIFGNEINLDQERKNLLNIKLQNYRYQRDSSILITGQHEKSLQWEGMPDLSTWLNSTLREIRKFTQRKIIFRHHPRSIPYLNLSKDLNIELQKPIKIISSYDDFDINFNYHCVLNHNSGPTIQAAICGTPVICHRSSLAYPISNTVSNIENLEYLDRESWFLKLCHTEWTVDEISKGLPFIRLQNEIEKSLDCLVS